LWILPIFGLILFSAESITSIRLNRQYRTASKYFYWSFFLLDPDPLNRSIKGQALLLIGESGLTLGI
jgi:hypothetical protein